MNDKQRKIELDGLKKTLNSIVNSTDLDKENDTVKAVIAELKSMIKERTK